MLKIILILLTNPKHTYIFFYRESLSLLMDVGYLMVVYTTSVLAIDAVNGFQSDIFCSPFDKTFVVEHPVNVYQIPVISCKHREQNQINSPAFY